MNTLKQSTIFVAVSALTPLAAQAEMVELSDTELRAIQGRYGADSTDTYFQDYRTDLRYLWTDLTTIEGKSAALHYVSWGTIMTGCAIRGEAWGTARGAIYEFADAPAAPPIWAGKTIAWTVVPAAIPPMIVGGALESPTATS